MNYNPVTIKETANWFKECLNSQDSLEIKNPIVVTSEGTLKRQKQLTSFDHDSIFSDIEPNPNFESCQRMLDFTQGKEFDGVIAIGGGSVMDTAKVAMATSGTRLNTIEEILIMKDPFPHKVPSIFIPTTHGTGSEVTMWATIWNIKEKKKYSISHSHLYPDIAILDGSLTLSLPIDISLSTILDALSHSFEAIWNKNRNQVSTDYAIQAICLIFDNVAKLKEDSGNLRVRENLLKAANIAGLAFSNTKTAASHSISYPLTIRYHIPHGIASSLPLLPLLKINHSEIEVELEQLMTELNINELSELLKCIEEIPGDSIKYTLQEWNVQREELEELVMLSFTKGRMENNIIDLTEEDVRWILNEIYS